MRSDIDAKRDAWRDHPGHWQAAILGLADGFGKNRDSMRMVLYTRENGLFDDVYYGNGKRNQPGLFSYNGRDPKSLPPAFRGRIEEELRKRRMRGAPYPWLIGIPYDDRADDMPLPKIADGSE